MITDGEEHQGLPSSADYGWLSACQVIGQTTATVTIKMFNLTCDGYYLDLTAVIPGAGTITTPATQRMGAKYARTWIDNGPGGVDSQIYRFLINGDLKVTGAVNNGFCSSFMPPCSFNGGLVHWDGHLDFALNCNTGIWTYSLSITHHDGDITHSAFSCSPSGPQTGAPAHQGESFHLVAPGGFTFLIGTPPAGNLLGDSIRPSIFQPPPVNPPIYGCLAEWKISSGSLSTVNNLGCGFGTFNCTPCQPGASCWTEQAFSGLFCCGSGLHFFTTTPVPGTLLANTGLITYTLGGWLAGPCPSGGYPWCGKLTLYLGATFVDVPSTCTMNPPGVNTHGLDIVVGVGITGVPGALLRTLCCSPTPFGSSETFIDLNNVLLPPNWTAGYGCASLSDLVFSLNL